MRLVSSPFYADVALSVYMKVKALGAREEGCQAKAATIASYLGLSKASVERGLTLLSRPAPDGVIELKSERRTLPGGTGTSAVRRTRPVKRTEAFVWLPVAAAEDLTPRQLRAFAVITFAQQMGIALTEGELAGYLMHHSGKKAGQPLTAAAAGVVVDELEAARWTTVQRRAGAQGRHLFVACDIAPTTGVELGEPVAAAVPEAVQECPQKPVDNAVNLSASPLVGEGSGLAVGEGSLAYKESPRTDSPDDEGALFSSAVGEVPVVEAVENPAEANACTDAPGGLALRADEKSQPSPSKPNDEKRSSGRGSARSSYTGPQLSMSPRIYAVLEPVHWLLARVNNPFMERKIAREVGRQLTAGMDAERLHHRLTARFAMVMSSEIRDPGRWLLGMALPRWGCGHLDCESGVRWSNGERCAVCEEVVADKFAARQSAQRIERDLSPEHGGRSGPSGACRDREPQRAIGGEGAALPAPRELEGPLRGSCGECECRIFLTGPALKDGLCKPCRTELAELGGRAGVDTAMAQPERTGDWSAYLAQLARQPLGEEVAS
ncbi:hypothetical protein [Streptomyces sp. NBC_01768]|uniref:hypothetical protein n=1 Tax=Streptomyces sp. NBC_01768 TaxID=2975938 RepID=UPI002DDA7997|nr:hypothetical protein [Streptomyces sp. NBC_01768]WSC34023.1 hypothetical protein OG902_46660 [Streptomyces sp. NBC_01768]